MLCSQLMELRKRLPLCAEPIALGCFTYLPVARVSQVDFAYACSAMAFGIQERMEFRVECKRCHRRVPDLPFEFIAFLL